jgi:ABC-type uncharacterized transport system permease subunit
MALGTNRESIVKLLTGAAAVLVALGLRIGTALALTGGRTALAMQFGWKPWVVTTFAMTLSGLLLVLAAAVCCRRGGRRR